MASSSRSFGGRAAAAQRPQGVPPRQGSCSIAGLGCGNPAAMRPLELCCGSCPLTQGVQIIASYTVVIGTFQLLVLLMPSAKAPKAHSEAEALVYCIKTIFDALAFFAGLKGLIGIIFKDPRRIRMLFVYHIVNIIVECIVTVVREIEVCKDLERLQKDSGLDCSAVRLVYFGSFCVKVLVFSYFVYVIWSLIVRLESGEYGSPPNPFDPEMADRGFGGFGSDPFQPQWIFLGQPSHEVSSSGGQRDSTRGHANNPSPFSGAARTLPEEGTALEPFRGTPHRLE